MIHEFETTKCKKCGTYLTADDIVWDENSEPVCAACYRGKTPDNFNQEDE